MSVEICQELCLLEINIMHIWQMLQLVSINDTTLQFFRKTPISSQITS